MVSYILDFCQISTRATSSVARPCHEVVLFAPSGYLREYVSSGWVIRHFFIDSGPYYARGLLGLSCPEASVKSYKAQMLTKRGLIAQFARTVNHVDSSVHTFTFGALIKIRLN